MVRREKPGLSLIFPGLLMRRLPRRRKEIENNEQEGV